MDGAGPTWLWSVTCIRSQAHNSQGVACLPAQETQRQAGGQAGRQGAPGEPCLVSTTGNAHWSAPLRSALGGLLGL